MVIGDMDITRNERILCRLPPNMTTNPKLTTINFQNDNEQGMAKTRWEILKKKRHDKGIQPGERRYDELSEEEKLGIEREEASLRQIFTPDTKTLNMYIYVTVRYLLA